jgi:hypothetical protein
MVVFGIVLGAPPRWMELKIMKRVGLVGGLLVWMAASGCSICCTPFDPAYPTYGGKWERTDRYFGRVGSAFAPAGAPVDEYDQAEELHEPTPAVPLHLEEMPSPEPDFAPMLMPDDE